MSRIYRSLPPSGTRIGLAFSGGLDTRCAVAWMSRQGLDVYCYTADLAQPDEKDPNEIPPIALEHGAKVARIIDWIIESLISAPFILWAMWPSFDRLMAAVPRDGSPLPDSAAQAFVDDMIAQQWTLVVISVIVTFAYQVPQNVLFGRTVGKRILGIRIRMLAVDRNPGWGSATVRWGTYTLGVLVLTALFAIVDYLWPLWDKPWRQALHDKAARTIVVRTRV